MSKRTIALYVDDIISSIQKIEKYTRTMTYASFAKDTMVIDAVVRNFEIIGEAARHIPKELQIRSPGIPWKEISGTRNKAAHEYFSVDTEIIWKTIQDDLPKLKKQIEKIHP